MQQKHLQCTILCHQNKFEIKLQANDNHAIVHMQSEERLLLQYLDQHITMSCLDQLKM